MLARGKVFFKQIRVFVERRDVYVMLIIVLVGFASFGLGRLSQTSDQVSLVQIENAFPVSERQMKAGEVEGVETESAVQPEVLQGGSFVGSKNSDKYHYPWCSGAQRIKDENKVWFETREHAEAAGYTPAANCKGL